METAAIILGLVSLFGTIVGFATNQMNNDFIEEMNEQNQEFQEETNLQNHVWSLEAAEWEYEHNKPQRQYADLLAAGITPAAAAQKVSGANVSYSPATAVAPHNMPKSTNMLNDSLSQVIDEIANYSSMTQAQAAAEKTQAETKVITETGVDKATAEIEKIIVDTFKSYSDIGVNSSQVELNEAQAELVSANTDLTNEKVATEQVNRRSIELSNDEKEIQLEFTRKTLEMSVKKTEAEIKLLAEQTAKLQGEVDSLEFDNKYKDWRNTYIDTYGVAPEQGWEDTLFKAVIDGKAKPMLDSFSQSLRLIFDADSSDIKEKIGYSVDGRHYDKFYRKYRPERPLRSYSYIDEETGRSVYVPGRFSFL